MSDDYRHERQILADLAVILSKDDDLLPPEMPCEGPEYDEWNRQRNELVKEFERRAGVQFRGHTKKGKGRSRKNAPLRPVEQTSAVKARARQIAEVLAKELVMGPRRIPGEAYPPKTKKRAR